MNPSGSNIALPPIRDVLLDEPTVGQLFFDIAHAAELLGVSVKAPGARRAEAETTATSLDDAHRALTSGQAAGVQLRYRFGGEEWWDTLIPTPAGVRLVRINHDQAMAAARSA